MNYSNAEIERDFLYKRMNVYFEEFNKIYKIYSRDKVRSDSTSSTDFRMDTKRLNMLLITIRRELD